MKNIPTNSMIRTSFQERKSLLILTLILFGFVGIYCYIHWNPPLPLYHIESIMLDKDTKPSVASPADNFSISLQKNLFPFDPNKISQEALLAFGIPVKTSAAWIHYREKGGKFNQARDIKKVYGMNQMLYDRISPYIQIGGPHPVTPSEKSKANTFIPMIKPMYSIDPNIASYQDLMQAGFSGKIAHTLINFRTAGKVFKSTQDLSKIYGLNDSILERIKPYLIFPELSNTAALIETKPKDAIGSMIDVNKADAATLRQLPGIGNAFALRITAYREKLGGFYNIDQLKEVYGLSDTSFVKFRALITISNPYRKIKINQDTLTAMYHPYLTKKDAILIQNYREQHGPFKSFDELQNLKAFDQKFWKRVQPYLDYSLSPRN